MLSDVISKAIALGLLVALSSCSLPKIGSDKPQPQVTAEPAPVVTEVPFDSEFSRDGTFQSHAHINNIDFVYTIWAAKTTPRMQEWYPQGDKYFSFTFQAYDMLRRLRDPFRTKRKIWLDRIRITSVTTTESGVTESPYGVNERAADVTFDPQALTRRNLGMLITSPKGALELRNQMIGTMADDTQGITLEFRATVNIETRAGSGKYTTRQIVQRLPIAIFESDFATRPQPVPYNAS